ncbi:MAG: trimethylamine methyltransferase family protein, partial [Verrucomicrobiae bacterium]|nr:trimethylamine methyltransferase family protein [Verrucomicrobiae bacterium]
MRMTVSYLSEPEKERIHRDSLRILAEVGVMFRNAKARQILARAGAKVDNTSQIARIPAELVARALKTAPRQFTLGARNPAFDFPMPSAFTGYTLDGAATFALDPKTGERRYALADDLAASLRIFEELPLGTVVWPNVVLSDIAEHSSDIRTTFLSFMNCSKHIQHEIHAPEHVPYVIEGLAAILGSEAAIKQRKIFSVCYCTIPPLTHDDEMCEACLELAEFHVPILPYPMPACGSTGPASIYSDVAVANAESLSALVLFQLANPGTPIIYGHAAGITNFSSGSFVEGAPESNLINGALGEMARFYGLPNTQAGCLTDAKAPGPQAVMEKMFTTLPLVLSGVDVINGIGEIASSQILVREQIVVDYELARLCKRMKDGIEVSDAKDYFDDVARVGPGGNFL